MTTLWSLKQSIISPGCFFPVIAVVFLSVVLSGFFTVLYSMQWGHTKSVDWLTTFLLSMAQSIVFVQPVKVRRRRFVLYSRTRRHIVNNSRFTSQQATGVAEGCDDITAESVI